MKEKPIVHTFADGSKFWEHSFETFKAKVYVPVTTLPDKVINFGFEAPYLLVFDEQERDAEEIKAYAEQIMLAEIAAEHAGSVVFISSRAEGGFAQADERLFVELIEHSRIHQYYEDGMAVLNNRFTGTCDGYAIRGAIFKTVLFGRGRAADYIAAHLLKTIQGAGLWGPADVTPGVCVLEDLSVMPKVERTDIPIVSVHNPVEINAYLKETVRDLLIMQEADHRKAYRNFIGRYKRWVGSLQTEPDLESLGMKREYGIVTLHTSADNDGDDKGTAMHEVGYLAFYNRHIMEEGTVPLMLAFHGGGDSAMYIAYVSEWYRVAHDHDFLLVCVENHINSTATEMLELLERLRERYPIDPARIYASGFSMGGCKTWDLYQEYPAVFAGLAPMDATFEVGLNVYGNPVHKEINQSTPVPIFYTGGEITPLPELPFQEEKCLQRMQYVLQVNKAVKKNTSSFDDREDWENKIWGIDGDIREEIYDEERDSTLTLQYFLSEDGIAYTVFGSIGGQGHECRHHTCEQAYRFLSRFRRVNGEIRNMHTEIKMC